MEEQVQGKWEYHEYRSIRVNGQTAAAVVVEQQHEKLTQESKVGFTSEQAEQLKSSNKDCHAAEEIEFIRQQHINVKQKQK